MSDRESMSGTHDCGADAAAYVLGALEPGEAKTFERHLESCTICRDEVTALQQVTTALPMAAPQHQAPRSLRRRVLAAAVQENAEPIAHDRARHRLGVGRSAWIWRGIALAGTCAAIALAVFAGLNMSTGNHARVIQAKVSGISGSASLRLSGGRGELIVHHLSPPPPGQIYEMWLKRPNRPPAPTSVLFSVTTSGAGEVGVPPRLRGVTEILVTPEPKGGSRIPTHSPVIVAPLT
jgi:anti-sigma-K factor RskA